VSEQFAGKYGRARVQSSNPETDFDIAFCFVGPLYASTFLAEHLDCIVVKFGGGDGMIKALATWLPVRDHPEEGLGQLEF
jgi:hypothetical protein